MSRPPSPAVLLLPALLSGACQDPVNAGGSPRMAAPADDPLVFDDPSPAKGTLDHLYQTVISRSCAGQPGLCHAGQFEPNMSSAALAYENLVNRPALEKRRVLRVAPADPAPERSLLMAKLRGVGVATRMPLGSQPLPEAELVLFEDWIRGGALRRPGAGPPPRLNNPPLPPEIAVFDRDGKRLDAAGPFTVAPGTRITLRHTVSDFETEDDKVPFAAFTMTTGQHNIVLTPGSQAPYLGLASYDPAAPAGQGGPLDWRFDFTVPEKVGVIGADGQVTEEPADGKSLTVLALYADGFEPQVSMAAFAQRPDLLKVKKP